MAKKDKWPLTLKEMRSLIDRLSPGNLHSFLLAAQAYLNRGRLAFGLAALLVH
jgi:hypothetical protein